MWLKIKYMGSKPIIVIVVSLTLIIYVSFIILTTTVLAHGQRQNALLKTLDVMLVIDNSGSMDNPKYRERFGRITDPEGRRFEAAKFVISYLAVDSSEGQRHYRVGVVSYGTNAILLAPLERVLPGYVAAHLRQVVDQERDIEKRKVDYSFTNSHLALETVLRELEAKRSFEQTEAPAVILFTDGRFSENSFGKPPEEYVKDVEAEVQKLARKNGRLYVVLIGEARKDEAEWQRLTRLTGGTTFSLSDPDKLIDVYHNLIRNLVGVEAFGTVTSGPIPLKPEEPKIKEIDLLERHYPYIVALILTVFQTQRDFDVTFIQPNGQKLTPAPQKVEREGEEYVIVWRILGPQYGKWKVELRGGSKAGEVQYWVDVRHPTVQVQEPDPHQPLAPGSPVKIQVKLVDEDGIVKEQPQFPITVDLMVTRPNRHQTTHHMRKQDDAYVFTFEDTEQLGEYKLKFIAKWTDAEGREFPINRGESSFSIAPVPYIKGLRTEPPVDRHPIQAENPLRLEVIIANVFPQKQLQVFAQVQDQHGRQVGEPFELLASKTSPNVYTGELRFSKTGQYTVTVYLTGVAKGDVPYGPGREIQIERSFPVQVVTTHPYIKTIHTDPPTEQPIQVQEPLRIEVGLENVAEQKQLQVFAQVQDQHGRQVGEPFELLASKTSPNVYTGELRFSKTGQYTVTVYLTGVAKGDVPYGPGREIQIERSFPVQVVTEIPRLEEVRFQPSKKSIPARQDVLIYAHVSKAEKARELRLFAQIDGIKGEWPLRDDGVKPDHVGGDGIFTGRLPGFGRERLPGFGDEGTYTVTLILQGQDLSGESFSVSRDLSVRVVASPLDWAARGGSALFLLIMLAFAGFQWRERSLRYLPLGTLRVLRPVEQKGQQWILDSYESKEVTLGVNAGHISLPTEEDLPEGLYARFYGRREGREVVTYVEGLSRERPVSISGTPLAKGKRARLFEGSTVKVGEYILEYLAPRLEPY